MCRKSAVTRKTIALLLLCLMTSTLAAQQTEVVTVMSKALTNIPDKEGLMITVEHPPGGADPVHRHDAQAFVYVLEGSVVMQVKGGEDFRHCRCDSTHHGRYSAQHPHPLLG